MKWKTCKVIGKKRNKQNWILEWDSILMNIRINFVILKSTSNINIIDKILLSSKISCVYYFCFALLYYYLVQYKCTFYGVDQFKIFYIIIRAMNFTKLTHLPVICI